MKRNTVIGILLATALTNLTFAQKSKMNPEDTEIWQPVPDKVTPGSNGSAPSDAIILSGEKWESVKGGKNPWEINDGVMTIRPGTGNIRTLQSYGDVQLHIEWRIPELSDSYKGQDRGNSGVFLQQFYEVQVLDSYTGTTYVNGQAGSVYKQYIPLVNASKPILEWQIFDIIYKAPRFDVGGNVTSPANMTVIHNGVLIQNHVILKGPTENTGYPLYKAHVDLPIYLQDHDHKVSYRNIWLRKL
ncbi:MAG: DUF1080 domain-containing protein [Proteobacteria bacterium]|nr:DUF1080 domain-containing protein [Pseudomonadota bacterium]